MAFKTDESFLEKLTMGAAGSRAVAVRLQGLGHEMAELERYTTANKIWSRKVKRLRLPDLFCVKCGLRVEARAKSKLEIKLSDSPMVSGREWDANLRDSDLIGLVKCYLEEGEVRAGSRVEFFCVGALRESVEVSRLGPPKSASEGAERDRTWPANAPPRDGRVARVGADGVRVEWGEGGSYTYRRSDAKNHVYVSEGEEFVGLEQFIIGSVEAPSELECPGATWSHLDDLSSEEPTDRYAAAKALGLLGDKKAVGALGQVSTNQDEDIRIRVEAIGALGRLGDLDAVEKLSVIAMSDEYPEGMPMEAVFILSELPWTSAADALEDIASKEELDEEIRAAAVWGLGSTGHGEAARLLGFIGDANDYVAVHAVIAAGSSLDQATCMAAAEMLKQESRQAAAAARLLASQGTDGASVLAQVAEQGSGEARLWALRGLGLAGRAALSAVELDRETLRLLEPMLVAEDDFLNEGEVLKLLLFVEKQVAFDPIV